MAWFKSKNAEEQERKHAEIIGRLDNIQMALAKQTYEDELVHKRYLDHGDLLVCVVGSDGYFRYANNAWCRVLQTTREYIMTHPFIEFLHSDDKEETADIYDFYVTTGQIGYRHWYNRYVGLEGKVSVIQWLAPIFDPQTGYNLYLATVAPSGVQGRKVFANGYEPFNWKHKFPKEES